jgi:hydroxyacylglutathione hydrolase
MKKRTKWILISIGAVVLLLAGFIISYFVIFENESGKFQLLETNTQIGNVTVLKDHIVNMYFVKNDDNYILFDAGENTQSVQNQMEQVGIDPDKVVAVFLTHTDFDHRASIDLFKNATIYISAEEEAMINGKTVRAFIISNTLSRSYTTIKNNGDVIINGFTVKAIVTPGHTVGSTCYLLDGKYLFTGDALAIVNGRIEPFNEFFNMNTAQARQSISIITALENVETIFTAHYGIGKDPKRMFADWNERNR